jgi:hypothetical protein
MAANAKPLTRGDGLCGVYSIINAFRLFGFSNVVDFNAVVSNISDATLGKYVKEGMSLTSLLALIRKILADVNLTSNFQISHAPRNDPQKRTFWRNVIGKTKAGHIIGSTRLIIQERTQGYSHWTVVRKDDGDLPLFITQPEVFIAQQGLFIVLHI